MDIIGHDMINLIFDLCDFHTLLNIRLLNKYCCNKINIVKYFANIKEHREYYTDFTNIDESTYATYTINIDNAPNLDYSNIFAKMFDDAFRRNPFRSVPIYLLCFNERYFISQYVLDNLIDIDELSCTGDTTYISTTVISNVCYNENKGEIIFKKLSVEYWETNILTSGIKIRVDNKVIMDNNYDNPQNIKYKLICYIGIYNLIKLFQNDL